MMMLGFLAVMISKSELDPALDMTRSAVLIFWVSSLAERSVNDL